MAAKDPDTLARVEVPAARRAVVGRAEDEVPSADHAVDDTGVTRQHQQAVTCPHVPLPDGLVGATRQYETVLDDDAVDVVGVAAQNADALAQLGLGGPDPRRLVFTASGQHRVVLA